MVDVDNHEDSLRELSKTSLVNNVTMLLCWSAQEAGRYLELYKTFEHAGPASIRAKQSTSYSENMVDFITVPRGINKTDAVGLVSNFGSIRTAINARPEEIGLIAGWGDKKVQRWSSAVKEPFRVRKAAKRSLTRESTQTASRQDTEAAARQRVEDAIPVAIEMQKSAPAAAPGSDADKRSEYRPAEILNNPQEGEGIVREVETFNTAPRPLKRKQVEEDMSEGVMAALSKLRNQ
jgi:DNA excision repair protein ERCC-1